MRGVSLLELLAVLAIAAILLGVAVPSLQSFVGSVRTTSAANDLLADLLFARTEALKRHRRVVLCKSSDGSGCAVAGEWQQGWIVFVDADEDGVRGPGEPVLQRQNGLGSAVHLTGNASLAKYVAYVGNGTTRQTGGGFQAGTLTVCRASSTPTTARQIVINATGRPRVQRTEVDRCV
ncbi:MAG: GspH/FimT family pseudopilin [Ramlibacter sp.]